MKMDSFSITIHGSTQENDVQQEILTAIQLKGKKKHRQTKFEPILKLNFLLYPLITREYKNSTNFCNRSLDQGKNYKGT